MRVWKDITQEDFTCSNKTNWPLISLNPSSPLFNRDSNTKASNSTSGSKSIQSFQSSSTTATITLLAMATRTSSKVSPPITSIAATSRSIPLQQALGRQEGLYLRHRTRATKRRAQQVELRMSMTTGSREQGVRQSLMKRGIRATR